jgi:hypothetical protein
MAAGAGSGGGLDGDAGARAAPEDARHPGAPGAALAAAVLAGRRPLVARAGAGRTAQGPPHQPALQDRCARSAPPLQAYQASGDGSGACAAPAAH